MGAGERLNGRGKKSGEEKSRTRVGAPGILLLTDQFRNHLESLPVIGHKNIFCVQSESSSFRVTFVTSYSKLFSANFLLACSPFIRDFKIGDYGLPTVGREALGTGTRQRALP